MICEYLEENKYDKSRPETPKENVFEYIYFKVE